MRRPRRRIVPEPEIIQTVTRDTNRQQRVREDPQHHQSRPERLVAVLERLVGFFHGGDVRRQGPFHGQLELRIDVGLGLVEFFDDCGAAGVGDAVGDCRGEGVGLVGAFGAPGDVVPIAEGIHVENVDITAHQQEVGWEGGEHVPGVEVDEGGDEVETECGD